MLNRVAGAQLRADPDGPTDAGTCRIGCIACLHAYTLTDMFSHNHKSRLETATTGNSASLFVSAAGMAVQLHMRLQAGLRVGPLCPLMAPDHSVLLPRMPRLTGRILGREWPAVLG